MGERSAINPRKFRRAMGRFATGITVITVQRGNVMHGMTANSFTSLSQDPPLVLFCVGKQARMANLLDGADGFAINVLSADQIPACQHFAGQSQTDREDVAILKSGPVAPLVPGSLVSLSCSLESIHEGGDHWIVVGRVLEIHMSEDEQPRPPLLFYRSRYANLNELPVPGPGDELFTNDVIRIYYDEWSVDVEEPANEDYIRAQIWQ